MSDLISRQDALKPFCIAPDGTRIPEVDCDNFPVEFSVEFIKKHLLSLPSAEAVDCTDFVLWLLDEIMDEENWELNAVADGEIIARKLKKLGLLEVKDGYYVRTPSAEAVEVVRCGECKHMMADGRCMEFADDGIRPSATDFCSYGDRREDGGA